MGLGEPGVRISSEEKICEPRNTVFIRDLFKSFWLLLQIIETNLMSKGIVLYVDTKFLSLRK